MFSLKFFITKVCRSYERTEYRGRTLEFKLVGVKMTKGMLTRIIIHDVPQLYLYNDIAIIE